MRNVYWRHRICINDGATYTQVTGRIEMNRNVELFNMKENL